MAALAFGEAWQIMVLWVPDAVRQALQALLLTVNLLVLPEILVLRG